MRVQNKMPHVSESVEQINLFRWAVLHERAYPELILLHHIPNGGLRNKTTAKRLKAEGVKPGVPDIFTSIKRVVSWPIHRVKIRDGPHVRQPGILVRGIS